MIILFVFAEVPTPASPIKRKVMCYPVVMKVPAPRLTQVEVHTDNDVTVLRYNNEKQKISTSHFHKLVSDCYFISLHLNEN